jgi:hypothetical protein
MFQDAFDSFPWASQALSLLALLLAPLGLSLLLWPATFHQIAARGRATPVVLNFTNRIMAIALLPLTLGLGADLYICMSRLLGETRGIMFAGTFTAGALFALYGGKLMSK